MSQAKVDQYKQSKADRKNWKKKQQQAMIIRVASAVAVVAVIAVVLVSVFRKDYGEVNTGASVFDDAALATVVGYDGYTLSDALDELE